eukprot:gene17156-48964_t
MPSQERAACGFGIITAGLLAVALHAARGPNTRRAAARGAHRERTEGGAADPDGGSAGRCAEEAAVTGGAPCAARAPARGPGVHVRRSAV